MHRRMALALGALLLPAADAGAAARTKCSTSVSSAQVTLGRPVTLSVALKPKAQRTVRLQARLSGAWVVLATKRTARNGRYRFTVPIFNAGKYTVRGQAPRTKQAKAVACRSFTVTVAAAGGGGENDTGSGASAFRAVYALASDQAADSGKVAAIVNTIDAVDGWFATQTTGSVQPRWVRSGGAPDVRTLKLDHTVAQYAAAADSFDLVAADLAAAGLPADGGKEKLAVWIDIDNSGACGATSGDVTVLFEAACDIHPSATDPWPYASSYLLAHEMTHNFGAVPDCAPHAGGGGHVLDDPRDVLYAGDQARDWDHQMLDPGHDDYYATGRADCPGIESSPFWTKTAAASS